VFIHLRVGTFITMHGYDDNNQPIQEIHEADGYTDKLVAVDRIQSITEKYILTTSSHGRVIYWEYEGSMKDIMQKLQKTDYLIT
jgi:hypothetical protein